jgi:hypothetical protein
MRHGEVPSKRGTTAGLCSGWATTEEVTCLQQQDRTGCWVQHQRGPSGLPGVVMAVVLQPGAVTAAVYCLLWKPSSCFRADLLHITSPKGSCVGQACSHCLHACSGTVTQCQE